MLRLDSVCKRFAGRPVLEDVSFAALPGSMTVIAGANGAGKSTLLHIAAGLLRPDKGEVTTTARPGGIGYLGHETLLYPQLTALENLQFWNALHGMGASETTLLNALERMDLAPHADEAASAFSRGMAQRLSLARLLLLEPELVLLDEPLTGLDTASVRRVRDELLDLKQNGAALVWVTHDLQSDLVDADAALLLKRDATYSLFARAEFSRILPEAAPC